MIVGIDFDNTIVDYNDIIYQEAVARNLIGKNFIKDKKVIRDTIRQLPNGEIEWQKIQAIVYGSRMNEAELIDGVEAFFGLCRQRGVKVYIISHKTEIASLGGPKINLRTTALSWMKKNRFFEAGCFDLSDDDVYFESTRLDKIGRIKSLNCTHFIDDLVETFLEPSFSEKMKKILYSPHKDCLFDDRDIKSVSSWKEIIDYFFGAEK